MRRPRAKFKVGQRVRCEITGKTFVIESTATIFGRRYLLRSEESGNPGRPKNQQFLDHQIEDGYLTILRKGRVRGPFPDLLFPKATP